MSEPHSITPATLAAAGEKNSAELAAALGSALGGEFSLTVGEPTSFGAGDSPNGFDDRGLAILLQFGQQTVVAVLPEAAGLLPSWYASPDVDQQAQLARLAQEFGKLLLPEETAEGQFVAKAVEHLGESLTRAGARPDAAILPLALKAGDAAGQLSIIWPLDSPAELFAAPDDAAQSAVSMPCVFAGRGVAARSEFERLPGYARSLLRIRVPVSVHLAAKKETVQEVVALAPGSIIKFEKGCEELLQMVIGGNSVAEGEAVKIGEKFGFRITSMVMPREHFLTLRRPRSAAVGPTGGETF